MEDKTGDAKGEGKIAKYARWVIVAAGALALFLIAGFSIYRKFAD